MSLRAAAFHESVAVARLDELFRSPWNQMFSGTTGTRCPKCGARFAVFHSDREDTDNASYVARLENLISENCDDGKHSAEILITE